MATKTKKYVSEKQRVRRLIIGAVLAVVIIFGAALGGAFAYSNYVNSGSQQRNTVSFESDNFEVNNSMLTYYYLTDFYNTYSSYGTYFEQQGLDPFTSMKTQVYDESQGQSWFDYFINNTASAVQSFLYYAEDAKANGFESDKVATLVDKQIEALTKTAEEQDLDLAKYITNRYGAGIKEQDIRDALELQAYASEYYNKVVEDYKDSLTDEEYETYYAENTNSLNKVDYRKYTISAEVAEDADDAAKQTAYDAASAKAKELEEAAAGGVDAFVAWVTEDLNAKNAVAEAPVSEVEIESQATAVTEAGSYAEGDGFSEWAFDSARAAGDVTLIDDGAGNYTVYMMEKPAYRQEDETKNVRHILLTEGTYGSDEAVSAKADEILEKYKAGEQTEDAFDALAVEFNEDGNSLYEDVAKGQMVAEFENWIFDEARVAGDTDVVKTEYGYHVMYFVGDGMASWKNAAYNAMLQTRMDEMATGFQEKYEVTYNSNNIYKLNDAVPATAFAGTGTGVEESTMSVDDVMDSAAAEETGVAEETVSAEETGVTEETVSEDTAVVDETVEETTAE